MLKESGIYGVVLFEQIVYVGSSINVHRRSLEHIRMLRKNEHHSPYFQNAWNKHGESAFTFRVLEYTSRSLLLEREQFYIDLYKPKYNYAPLAGSRLGTKQSPEAIDKVRHVHLGSKHTKEAKERISKALLGNRNGLGHKHTKEAKEKMHKTNAAKKAAGIKRKRNPMSEETKRKISEAQKGKPRLTME